MAMRSSSVGSAERRRHAARSRPVRGKVTSVGTFSTKKALRRSRGTLTRRYRGSRVSTWVRTEPSGAVSCAAPANRSSRSVMRTCLMKEVLLCSLKSGALGSGSVSIRKGVRAGPAAAGEDDEEDEDEDDKEARALLSSPSPAACPSLMAAAETAGAEEEGAEEEGAGWTVVISSSPWKVWKTTELPGLRVPPRPWRGGGDGAGGREEKYR